MLDEIGYEGPNPLARTASVLASDRNQGTRDPDVLLKKRQGKQPVATTTNKAILAAQDKARKVPRKPVVIAGVDMGYTRPVTKDAK